MRLFIGDSELDIAPDELPAFTFSVSDIIEVDKIRGARSTTMVLPVTAENRRALGGYSLSEVAPAQGRDIKVVHGSALNFEGKAIVTRRSDKELELIAVGNNASWASDLKGLKIQDLDLGIMEDHSAANVEASWTADTLHLFPIIDYGTLENRAGSYQVPLTMIRPALRVSRVIENALTANGWSINWNGTLGNFIDKVIMPDTSDALKVTASQFDEVKATAAITIPQTTTIAASTASDMSPALVVDNEISDPGGNYNPAGDGLYTSPLIMTASPKVTGTIIVTSPTASGGVYIKMDITGAAQYTLIQPSLTETVGANVVRYFNLEDFPVTPMPIGVGSTLSVNLYFAAFTSGGTVDVNDFEITYEAAAIGYQEGVDVSLNSVNPDTPILDLVNWLATTYNIIMRTEGQSIEAWTYDEFYDDPALGTGLDISERVTGDVEKHTETVPKRYEFRHKEDNKDRLLAEYQALYGLNYGDADSEVSNGYDDPYEVKVGYAATVSAFVLGAFSVPALRDIDGVATGGFYNNRYKWTSRLLYFEGVGDGAWRMTGVQVDTYPIVYSAGARGTVLFGDTPEAGTQGTVNKYWINRLQRVGAPVANALVYWHDHEIANLDPGRPVWVHDGQHGGWYYVSEIKQHRFGMGVPAETILIPV